jgi:hypothetical protein
MKRFLGAVMMLFVVFAPRAYADGIPIFGVTQAIISLSTNVGGDNETFSFTGPLININGGGTAVCDWCLPFDFSLSPGSSLNPSIGLVTFDNTYGTARIGGQTFDLSGGFLFNSSITAIGSFTFPTNGRRSFTVSVPAGFSGQIIQGSAPSLPNYDLQILGYGVGTMVLNFTLVPSQNGAPAFYEFSRGQFSLVPTPEPGTLGMMATGLAGIVGMIRRKTRICLQKSAIN